MSKVESENSSSPTDRARNGSTIVDVSAVKRAAWPNQSRVKVVQIAKQAFDDGKTLSTKFRKIQLKGMLKFLKEREDELLEALYKDLQKPKQEAIVMEFTPLISELKTMLESLETWSRPESPAKPLSFFFDKAEIYKDPYGVVLVMGSWNYPLQLCLMPVIGAIAAGNCVVIKPSDLSPATSQVIADFLPNYIDGDCYHVYLGGIPETTELLEQKFDYIFYTGSTAVGKIIHKAANKYLTPVTLELGGKSPCYIDETADLEKTAKRILWGKCANAGQTCIAPDYVLCTKSVQEKFVKHAKEALKEFYGGNVRNSNDYCRMITDRHFVRIKNLMDGLKIAVGGGADPSTRFIEPTIATDVNPNHPIMQEEIFGPILPILTIRDIEEAIRFINERDKPLAFYIFTKNSKHIELLLRKTSSGGVTINDTVLHFACECLPFGGVGDSGMGAYHGKESFDIFTHRKSVLKRNYRAVPEMILASRYPPYSKAKTSMITMGLQMRQTIPFTFFKYLFVFLLGIGITVAVYYICKNT